MTENQTPTKKREWLRLVRKYSVPGFVALYLTLSIPVYGWILLDAATGSFRSLAWLGIAVPDTPEFITLLKLGFYAATGGAIGGVTFGMMNLQKHTIKGRFKVVYVGDYLLRPFGAAALAVVIFALIRGGVLTILGAGTDPSTNAASSLSTFGIGFLSGFGSLQVVRKLQELIEQIFGEESEEPDDDETPKPNE